MNDSKLGRRKFVETSLLGCSAALLASCKTTGSQSSAKTTEKIEGRNIAKRNRYSMFSEDGQQMVKVYEDIVGRMKERDRVNSPAAIIDAYYSAGSLGDSDYDLVRDWSGWVSQAVIHERSCPHGNWYFLPWHRAYLFAFEEICRDVALSIPLASRRYPDQSMDFYYKNFAVPYWDWTANAGLPELFFAKDSALNVNEDPILNELGGFPRRITADDRVSQMQEAIFGAGNIEAMLKATSFDVFCSAPAPGIRDNAGGGQGLLEAQPHNTGHGAVGGIMGSYLSPYDPIFWTHHCNVDRLWSLWIEQRIAAGETASILPAAGEADYQSMSTHEEASFKYTTGDWLSGPVLEEPIRTEPLKGFYKPNGQKYQEGAAIGLSIGNTINLHHTHGIDYDSSADSNRDVLQAYQAKLKDPVQSLVKSFPLPKSAVQSQSGSQYSYTMNSLGSFPALKLALTQVLAMPPHKSAIKLIATNLKAPFAAQYGLPKAIENKNRDFYLVISAKVAGQSFDSPLGRYAFFGENHGTHGNHGVNVSFNIDALARRLGKKTI